MSDTPPPRNGQQKRDAAWAAAQREQYRAEERAKVRADTPPDDAPPDDPPSRERAPEAPTAPTPPYIQVPGRLPPDDPWTIRRKPAPAAAAETETLLNNLIEECGFLMREVAFRLICKAGDAIDRLAYMDRAVSFAQAGATVGDTVARLRGGAGVTETRQRFTVEHVQAAAPEGEGAKPQS